MPPKVIEYFDYNILFFYMWALLFGNPQSASDVYTYTKKYPLHLLYKIFKGQCGMKVIDLDIHVSTRIYLSTVFIFIYMLISYIPVNSK